MSKSDLYRLSRKEPYVQKHDVNTRGNTKIKFRLMTKCSSKYLGSLLYRGTCLWDKLERNVQDLPYIRQFSNVISKNYQVYKYLLN